MSLPLMSANPKYSRYLIGRYTYGEPKIEDFASGATLEIGSFCSFSRDVSILLSGEHHTDWVTTSPLANLLWQSRRFRLSHSQNGSRGSVWIGSDVWVCLEATILGGVNIGHGAVIGAKAVVTRNVQPYSVVAGNPARHRRWRFNDLKRPPGRGLVTISADLEIPMICKRLLATKWWDWEDEKIREYMPLLLSDRVEDFLEKAEAVT